MNDNVEPIRTGIVPSFDTSREMTQFVAEKLAEYISVAGVEPTSIAIVLLGSDSMTAFDVAHSWTPEDETRSRLQCCATASALLMKRAIGV